jgi:hypothetical protein
MKSLVRIVRVESSADGTFGVLSVAGRAFCVCLEPPAAGNRPFVSCIPAGIYKCGRVLSPRHGRTFEVKRVPGREDILFHRGNVAEHTAGCILLGRRFGALGSVRGVLASDDAMDEFLAMMEGTDEFRLQVEDVNQLSEAA